MNQRPTGLSLSKAIVGFLQYKSAEDLSPVTVSGYDHDLKLWMEHIFNQLKIHGEDETAADELGKHLFQELGYKKEPEMKAKIIWRPKLRNNRYRQNWNRLEWNCVKKPQNWLSRSRSLLYRATEGLH